ncbi:MAG TPA: amino acid adenylation domain-containing protein, partial [Pyrinomonadaceae bacterium]
YADYAAWLNELLDSSEPHEAHAYWGASAEVPPVRLPLERERATKAHEDGAGAVGQFCLRLDEELTARIEQSAAEMKADLSDVLLAAWAALLWRLTGERDVSVEVCSDGRNYDYLRPALGCFAQYLPVRCRFEDYRFDEVVELVRDAVASARTRQEYYGAEARSLRDGAAPSGGIGFDYRERWPEACAGELRASEWRVEGRGERLKLRLSAEGGGGRLDLRLEYDAALYGAEEAERLCGRYAALLRGAARGTGEAAATLPLLGAREREQLLTEWNDTAEPFPAHLCLHELFEQQAARTPDAVALTSEAGELSFSELNSRANRLAHYLVSLGVGPETLVGVLMERSTELVVSLLAVLKAGAAYLPLDPTYPQERLVFMLEDAGAPVLLTQERLLDSAPVHWGQTFCVDGQWDEVEGLSDEDPRAGSDPSNLAYVIYTSGSTGRPKGVCVEHRGLVNYLSWCLTRYPVGSGSGAPLHSGVAFDLSVTTLYAPLLCGRAVRLLPVGEELTGLAEVWRRHASEPLSFVKLTPAHLRLLAAQLGPEGASPAGALSLIVGGENLPEEEVEFWRRHAPGVALYNEYGPTEAVVGCCVHEASEASGGSSVPVGRAAANTRLYVLDVLGEPAPVGAAGELYIGGVCVARGYLNRPSLTAERFVPDPFSVEAGARLYKTGDVARYLAGGDIEFLGRADEQVKVRGYRVELGEIETVLVGHGRVRECAVVAREDAPGDKRLVAYVVGPDIGEKVADELRSYLGERLPEYMVPSRYVVLESFPLTPSGKVDRRNLPAPEYTRDEQAHDYVAPRTPAEQLLANVWAEVLHLPRVGIHDNFFELGGHSLLAVRVVSRVREVFKVELPLRALFDSATVASLSDVVEKESGAGHGLALAPIEPAGRGGSLPLSFAQQRLWFIDQLDPGSSAYNLASAVRLRGRLDADALRRTLSEVVRRHEVLRTTFEERDGQPVQVIHEPEPLRLEVEDLGKAPNPEEEARRLATQEARTPVDLSAGPLVRARLLRLSEEEHVLAVTMHHIVSDGWSMGVLIREVAGLYEAYARGQESPLPEPEVQYADYAAWQREHLAGEALERQLEYWRKQLGGGLPTLELPTDRPRPAVQRLSGATERAEMGDVGGPLWELSRREGVTPFMVLLAAWQVLLARYSGQEDIVVGTPV